MKIFKELSRLIKHRIASVIPVVKTIGKWMATLGPILYALYWGIRLLGLLLGFPLS